MAKRVTYKSSGVDITKANRFVRSIARLTKEQTTAGVLKRKGAFGGLFAFEKTKYKSPVLVSSTDGVGTKLLLAKALARHNTIGIDLVAMNVNDILCTGAQPLFFLDYIACGKINHKVLKNVMRGIVKGCGQSNCALIGGETAEMPGMYKKDDYDLAGFAVGAVDKKRMITGSAIQEGNRLIGLASSGLHANGFSLVRKVLSPGLQKKHARELLKPTRIYVKPVLRLLDRVNVKGIAHVTGGAFYDKVTKILPQGKCFRIDKHSWPVPRIFSLLQEKGRVSDREMYRTFNMGIGMVLIVEKRDVKRSFSILKQCRVPSWEIGEVIKHQQRKILL